MFIDSYESFSGYVVTLLLLSFYYDIRHLRVTLNLSHPWRSVPRTQAQYWHQLLETNRSSCGTQRQESISRLSVEKGKVYHLLRHALPCFYTTLSNDINIHQSILRGHTDWVKCVSWSPFKSGALASVSDDGQLLLWQVAGRGASVIESLVGGHDDFVTAVAFSLHDGNILASASTDNTVVVWNIKSGQPIYVFPDSHSGKKRKL